MTGKDDRPLVEAVFENSEVAIDQLVDSEVLKEIPVVGTAVKVCKALDTIRDRAFAAKMQRFLFGVGTNDPRVRDKWRKKVHQSSDDAKRIGETLFFILERLTDLKKCEIVAFLFTAFVDDVIDTATLCRLVQAVDMAYLDDLEDLIEVHRPPEKCKEAWARQLAPSGLTEIVVGMRFSDAGELSFQISKSGHAFRNAIFHGRKSRTGG